MGTRQDLIREMEEANLTTDERKMACFIFVYNGLRSALGYIESTVKLKRERKWKRARNGQKTSTG